MPRKRKRDTNPETRFRNMLEAQGRPAIAGLSRVGLVGSVAQALTPSVLQQSVGDVESVGAAQLLVMSATGDSIASGGDYVAFSSIVAQHGFDTVPPSGGAWVHPFDGVYALTYEHQWDIYTDGGTVALELDGTLIPEGTIMDGTDGQEGRGTILYVAEAGQVGKIKVTQSSGSAQTCNALVRVGITDPKVAPSAPGTGNVVSLGTQGAPDVAAWSGIPIGWPDSGAHWIWHTALVSGGRPDWEEGWFEGVYESVSATAVTVHFSADNLCSVSLNGTLLGSDSLHEDAATSVSATLAAGTNVFECYAQNSTLGVPHPAGFILTVVRNSDSAILFRTTDVAGWTGYTAEPVGWTGP